MTKKKQSDEPNVRDALTTAFVEELQRDFAEHGKEIIETVRKESPSKYAELVLRLIPLEPRMIETGDPRDRRMAPARRRTIRTR
jgi:hypothetical protein